MNKIYNNLFYTFGTDLSHMHKSKELIFAQKYKFLKNNIFEGINGQTYCIPIRTDNGKLMPLQQIQNNIKKFISYAQNNPQINFQITNIACNENEYDNFQIANCFKNISDNCLLPAEWQSYTNKNKKIGIFFDENFN